MNFKEIETITTCLIEEYQSYLKGSEIGPPIQVELIVENLFNLKIRKANIPEGCSGKLHLRENTILVSNRDSKERQRFTIAHELGHFCLHKQKPDKKCCTDKSTRIETEANVFAAETLMPKRMIYENFIKELMRLTKKDLNWLLRLSKRLPIHNLFLLNQSISNYVVTDFKNINQKEDVLISVIPVLAKVFKVSNDAITWRLQSLKIPEYFLSNKTMDALLQ